MDFIMMVGLPGAGKTTKAHELAVEYNAKVYSSDDIRKELYGDSRIQDNHQHVFDTMRNRIKQDLAEGKSVIHDATNISYKKRMALLQEVKKYNPNTACYLIIKPYDKCLEDNALRQYPVPENVMKSMLSRFWIPQEYEGWNEIHVGFTHQCCGENPLSKALESTFEYDQENKYHALPLGEHMLETKNILKNIARLDVNNDKDIILATAALFHDIGKPFTKTFITKKGQPTEDARYYGHANVGAYMFLTLSRDDDVPLWAMLEACNFIQWHMMPYNLEANGGCAKFINLVGQEFYNRLMLLHVADRAAH